MAYSQLITQISQKVTLSHSHLITRSFCHRVNSSPYSCAAFSLYYMKILVKLCGFFSVLRGSSRKRLCGGRRTAASVDYDGGREIAIKPHTNFT